MYVCMYVVCIQVNLWRRSYDVPPPKMDQDNEYWPGKDPRYHELSVRNTRVYIYHRERE